MPETPTGNYVIELKARYDDPEETEERRQTLEAGKVHGFSQPITKRNTSGIIADAVEQFRCALLDRVRTYREQAIEYL